MIFPGFVSRTIFVLLFSCFFAGSIFAAGTIPRDGLRLELTLATGSQDTSGNGRIVSSTGVAPTYQIDPLYGVPFAQFSGSGEYKVNTAWTPGAGDDFAVSFWIRLNTIQLTRNISNNYTELTARAYDVNGRPIVSTNYDKPQVVFSSKMGSSDINALRFAISKEGQCSLNSIGRINSSYATNQPDQYSDTLDYLNSWFNCQNIIDNKWHHLILQKKAGVVTVLIDGASIYSSVNPLTVTKIISLGSLGYAGNPSIYSYYPTSIKQDIYDSHWYRGGMMSFHLYSRSLTDAEIEALGDEYRYAQSDLAGAGNIQVNMDKYSKPMLYANFRNILNALNKDNVSYEYSVNSGSFTPITDITQIASNSGTIDYRIGVDLSGTPDGRTSVIFRVRGANQSFQNIGTVIFTKLDNQVSIIINQPTTDMSIDKTITATTVGGGQLFLAQTRGASCDASIITWESYSDLTFAGKSDNGIRICYKAVFSTINKTIYQLSAAIQGIQPKEQINMNYGIFADYLLWTKSAYIKPTDSTNIILELINITPRTTSYGNTNLYQGYSVSTGNNITMTDINGDGLVDFLYSQNEPIRRAIIVNNGNYTFKTTYKCAIDVLNSVNTYYGDCADPTR